MAGVEEACLYIVQRPWLVVKLMQFAIVWLPDLAAGVCTSRLSCFQPPGDGLGEEIFSHLVVACVKTHLSHVLLLLLNLCFHCGKRPGASPEPLDHACNQLTLAIPLCQHDTVDAQVAKVSHKRPACHWIRTEG